MICAGKSVVVVCGISVIELTSNEPLDSACHFSRGRKIAGYLDKKLKIAPPLRTARRVLIY